MVLYVGMVSLWYFMNNREIENQIISPFSKP